MLLQVYLLVRLNFKTYKDDMCYIANVGDSRAIMSANGGEYTVLLSRDHKPNDELETKRI